MRSSKAAFDLIVSEEVTSQAVYSKKYRKPEWPGASSGATVGIGYDLGQTPRATILADWKGRVSDEMLSAMLSASGITGSSAKPVAKRLRANIDIPWETALAVHEECVIPRWEEMVSKSLPNTDKLSPDCFGALLSLVFNRGASFNNKDDRYREMRAIKAYMAAEDWDSIPAEFRAMKRLWPNLPGLLRRRDREAALFARGIKNIGVSRPPRIDDLAPAPTTPADELDSKPAATVVVPADEGVRGDPELWNVQRRLKAMMYNPGGLDGLWGGMSAGAITGFINDRKLSIVPPASMELFHAVKEELNVEIGRAEGERYTRPILPERAEVTPAELAQKLPEVKAAITAERLGFWGSIAATSSTVITGVAKSFGDAVEWLNPVKQFVGDVPWPVWVGGALIVSGALYYISRKSGDAKNAATQAYQEGSRI